MSIPVIEQAKNPGSGTRPSYQGHAGRSSARRAPAPRVAPGKPTASAPPAEGAAGRARRGVKLRAGRPCFGGPYRPLPSCANLGKLRD